MAVTAQPAEDSHFLFHRVDSGSDSGGQAWWQVTLPLSHLTSSEKQYFVSVEQSQETLVNRRQQK